MGAQETLRIIVDAGQLDQIISRVRNANTQTNTLSRQVNDARRSARAAGINLDDIPTLNREMRMLANTLNIPGLRAAQGALFKGRLGIKAAQLQREAEAVAGLDTALAARLSMQSLIGNAALVAFVVKIVYDTIQRFIKEEEARNAALEDMLREGLELNHQESEALSREQAGFASFLDQFEAGIASEGIKKTIQTTIHEILLSYPGVFPYTDPEYVSPYSENLP